MKNLIIAILSILLHVSILNGKDLIVQGNLTVESDSITKAKTVNVFSKTAIQLNFKIDGNKENITYRIVGLTEHGKLIDLESGAFDQLPFPLIRTIVDPGESVDRIGVLIRRKSKDYFFTFDAKKEINKVLKLVHPESFTKLGF